MAARKSSQDSFFSDPGSSVAASGVSGLGPPLASSSHCRDDCNTTYDVFPQRGGGYALNETYNVNETNTGLDCSLDDALALVQEGAHPPPLTRLPGWQRNGTGFFLPGRFPQGCPGQPGWWLISSPDDCRPPSTMQPGGHGAGGQQGTYQPPGPETMTAFPPGGGRPFPPGGPGASRPCPPGCCPCKGFIPPPTQAPGTHRPPGPGSPQRPGGVVDCTIAGTQRGGPTDRNETVQQWMRDSPPSEMSSPHTSPRNIGGVVVSPHQTQRTPTKKDPEVAEWTARGSPSRTSPEPYSVEFLYDSFNAIEGTALNEVQNNSNESQALNDTVNAVGKSNENDEIQRGST